MKLIGLALVGLLFVAVFGAKATQSALKFIGLLVALFVVIALVVVLRSQPRCGEPTWDGNAGMYRSHCPPP